MSAPLMPLAERLRPKALSDVIGQQHLLGLGKPLYESSKHQHLHSMILWGPPGVGKTTLAEIMASSWGAHFEKLSAVFSGVKELRSVLQEAERLHALNLPVVLFVDEIHRFNKSQQDAFLYHLEQGVIILIGATTENPSFELNSALLSRVQVYVLNPLSFAELKQVLANALAVLDPDKIYSIAPEAERILLELADGDARRLLNLIELSLQSAAAQSVAVIQAEFLLKLLPTYVRRFDKAGDIFYEQISALHKSVRGSDPDAALYWFCRMLDGGADPKYLGRRLLRMAWEDVGLADPRAEALAVDALSTYERLGSPEGELALAEAVLYLAAAPKSNAAYQAYNAARAFVAKDQSRPVPMHLRNAPTKLMQQQGFGKHYRYAHDETHHYAAGENYWPTGLSAQAWYQPIDQGLEVKIKEKLLWLKQLDRAKNKES